MLIRFVKSALPLAISVIEFFTVISGWTINFTIKALINTETIIVPIIIENGDLLLDESSENEIIINVKLLDLINYDDYKDLNKKGIKDKVLKVLLEEK